MLFWPLIILKLQYNLFAKSAQKTEIGQFMKRKSIIGSFVAGVL